MALSTIEEMLGHLRRIKSRSDLDDGMINQIMRFEAVLRLLSTFIKHHDVLLPDSLVEIRKKIKHIVELLHSTFGEIPVESQTNLDVQRLVSLLLDYIEGNTTLRFSNELNASNLSENMDCLSSNLSDLLMFLESEGSDALGFNRFLKNLKTIQKKMGFFRYLYAVKINGYVDHDKLEGLETRIRFLTGNVEEFLLDFWTFVVEKSRKDDIDEYEEEIVEICAFFGKPPYLLCLVMLVQLEMREIFLGEPKASMFCQSKTFRYQKLPKGFSRHLSSTLVFLGSKKLEAKFLNNDSARIIGGAIEFLLVFLADVPNRFNDDKTLNEVLEKVGDIVGDVLFVIQKLLPNSTTKDGASKINLNLIPIVEKTENLRTQEEKYYKSMKFTPSHEFPTVGGLIFLDSILRRLNEILKSESSLDFMMKPHIGILEKEFSFLTSFFRDVEKVHHIHKCFEDLQRRTINLAYEVEVAIDSVLSQHNALWHLYCSLPTILKEIKHIKADVTEMQPDDLALKSRVVVKPSTHPPNKQSDHVNDEEIMGFENQMNEIIQHLIKGTHELDVIPILGMGGQGKTTLVRKVYDNNRIVSHFDRLAWCCVSQTYNRMGLLREIYNQVSENMLDKDDDVADMLRKRLMGKRYLIVLDDMWDVKVWEDLRLSFPDGKGSRIIVTTRLKDVGMQVKLHSDPHSLPFLTPQESRELLLKRVFQKEGCPSELQDVSLEVAERCKGLPLTVVLVAGIIKRKKADTSWWHKVKDSLISLLGESEEYSRATMQLSYDNLPDHIRPCLLYMGIFPEDVRIPVSKLISLWIAEGFVQNNEAEGYLMELISSNVVMVSKRRHNGKVKYCQVHDIVLHFCLKKSKEEKFMLAVKGHNSQLESLPSEWKVSRLSFNFTDELSEIELLGSKARKPFHQHMRTLMVTSLSRSSLWEPYSLFSKLRLLKVLDLSSRRLLSFTSATLHPLILLRYLAVSTNEFDFHSESLFRHLETIIVKGGLNEVLFPATFWKMGNLRHVEIDQAVFYLKNDKQRILEESSKLENLRILKEVEFPSDCTNVLLRRCPNLQQLHLRSDYDSAATDGPKLESLTQLQSLDLTFYGSIILSESNLPLNLNKLALTGAHIVSAASLIAGLPSLEYLKLEDLDFESKEWSLGQDITFDKLKLLKLVRLGISRWDASDNSFPMLETLVIKRCYELEEIPSSFADIQTLKQIKLFGGKKESLEASAVTIKGDIEEIQGCDRLDLIIKVY